MPVSAPSARVAALLLGALLAVPPNAATAKRAAKADPCGDPTMISYAYETHWGKVVEVPDGVTVVVECVVDPMPPGHPPAALRCVRETLKLVQLELPQDSRLAVKARDELAKRTLGRTVAYALSHVQETPGVVNAIVDADFDDPQNERLLRAGLASYRDFGDYAVDWYTDCVYQRLESEARAAKRGIWKAG